MDSSDYNINKLFDYIRNHEWNKFIELLDSALNADSNIYSFEEFENHICTRINSVWIQTNAELIGEYYVKDSDKIMEYVELKEFIKDTLEYNEIEELKRELSDNFGMLKLMLLVEC